MTAETTNNNVAAIGAAITGVIAALGGPKVIRFVVGMAGRRASAEERLREELRKEQAELRAELKGRIDELERQYREVSKELEEWKLKYFRLEAEHRVLLARLGLKPLEPIGDYAEIPALPTAAN